MTTAELMREAWRWDALAMALPGAVLAGCLAVRARYGRQPGETEAGGNIIWILMGVAVLVLALASPVRELAEQYLFSAHMLQHLLLLLVAPPLLLMGLPRWHREAGGWGRGALASMACWLAGVGAMYVWHVPTLCNAAGSSPGVFRLQAVSLLVCGGIFWWPIAGPRTDQRFAPLKGMLYLFSACLACTLLGIYLTFAPVTVCAVYMDPADPQGILALARNGWGMTPMRDQQIGGLLMWVPACLVYLIGIMGLFARWYGERAGTPVPEPGYAAGSPSRKATV